MGSFLPKKIGTTLINDGKDREGHSTLVKVGDGFAFEIDADKDEVTEGGLGT